MHLVVNRLLFPGHGALVHRIGGLEVLVDYRAEEQNGTRACVAVLPYRSIIEAMSIPKNPCIVDLGANGGGFPLMMLRLGFSPRRVVAVEMNPVTYARMLLNLEMNLRCKLICRNAAVCDRDGKVEIELGIGSISDSLDFGSGGRGKTAMRRIDTVSLTRLLTETLGGDEVDLCKVDIEGAEYPILMGDEIEGFRRCRNVIVELHRDRGFSFEEVDRRFAAIGFEKLDARSPYESNVFGYVRVD